MVKKQARRIEQLRADEISLPAPAAMVFIPCKDGRSHTPEEWASADALAAGADVLLEAVLEVDGLTAGP